jgi:Cu(I)/Ag(I) efflux system membrane fusion protein
MKFSAQLFVAALVLLTWSCGPETTSEISEAAAPEPTEAATSPAVLEAFRVELEDLTADYLDIKDALVQSDLALATSAGANFGTALEAVDASELTGIDRTDWERLSVDLVDHGSAIAGATDLETARQQFSLLSPALVQTIKRYSANDEALYVQYCPMAFDNAGASWISASEEIRNPYFGDAMLTCGKVEETLAAE